MAKTGWTLEYMNGLPERHLLFVYHHLKKHNDEYWDRLGSHLGTMWTQETLRTLEEKATGAGTRSERIFVPLSLVVNPELPKALLGKTDSPTPGGDSHSGGDGLHTAMPMPEGDEVVNMGTLSKEEFFGLVANAGIGTGN